MEHILRINSEQRKPLPVKICDRCILLSRELDLLTIEMASVSAPTIGSNVARRGTTHDRPTLEEKRNILELYPSQKGLPVSFTDLQEESKLLANNLKVQNFCGSAGWVANVLKSNQLQTVGLQGEEMGSDPEISEKWITEDSPEILQGYKNAEIFKCDGTGSYLRSTPRKTLLKVGQRIKGSKKATERISVIFYCSSSGEKIPPLIIGRSKKPRAFTKAKLGFKKVGFTWANNTKAWMTKAVFTPWLEELNERMEKQNRKILLLLHNASGHNVDSLSHGIIKAFQAHESAAKAEHRRENRKDFQNLVEYKKSLTVLHSVKWIMKGESKVDSRTIRNCFRKSGAFQIVENK
ncbi:hypothetical protein RvY_15446 [Ramazzottius varieornatus]|uniref:DDE-1 domain-containing protein n=1 Tax=Ramazzottius varieornatus TaxID=947166 RepID=A0A1D1VW72_RAMVA|nr:hypothetical protein RvY_15446 [Ramazzottius varieornatus]